LSGTAVALLLEQKAAQDVQRKELGDAWTETGYVFTTDDGNPIFPTSVTTWFRKFIRRSDLPYVSVHSLRHTFASLQISDGVPLVVVSRQLGHAKASTTANIYAHVIAEAEAKADQTFDRFSDVIQPNKHQTNAKGKGQTESA
jgi:integrase